MTLAELDQGAEATIVKLKGRGAFRKRIMEMGFIKGQKVKVIRKAPLLDPVEYRVMGYNVSLRLSEAHLVEVSLEEINGSSLNFGDVSQRIDDEISGNGLKSRIIDVALVGNPNSGKSSLFNYFSHIKAKVANYSGVTIEAKTARYYYKGYTFNVTDLPGTYSFTSYSPEELYVRQHILNEMPDVIVNVLNASALERNLYLTTQLIDMDIKVVAALNMFDEFKEKGDKFDYKHLGEMVGIPFIPTIGTKGTGVNELLDKIIDVFEDRDTVQRHIHINYGEFLERGIRKIQDAIWKNKNFTDHISSRFYAIKLLEKDQSAISELSHLENIAEITAIALDEIKRIENNYSEDAETLISDAKYGFIAGGLKETYRENKQKRKERTDTEVIDTFLTHRLFGFPFFLLFMWMMFYATFKLGEYPMTLLELGVGLIKDITQNIMPDGMLKDLVSNGIIDGVGSVIVFLPNILILFFFTSLMEDTGYMARVSFIMDKLMHKIGLHGRSFIPLLMGFGCNVPAILATKTIESRVDRLVTMLIIPFMSCSARLPVYILIIGAVFPWNPTLMLFMVYLTGILLGIIISLLLKKTVFRKTEAPFVMELPPYRLPTIKTILMNMWFRASQYLKKMGGIILVAVIIIWALGYFPQNKEILDTYDQKIRLLLNNSSEPASGDAGISPDSVPMSIDSAVHALENEKKAELLKNSYIGRLGKFIEPALEPLGFDWKMGVSLITGAAAKEIVVSTMAVLYQVEDDEESESNLRSALLSARHETGELTGQPVFSKLVAFGFLIFILIYFPCIAVIAAIKKESASLYWAAFIVIFTTGLAYLLAMGIYQIGIQF